MKRRKTLVLEKKDIEGLVSVRQSNEAIESAFKECGLGRVQMPAKIYLYLDKYKGDFRAMPAYIEKLGRCSLKWVNSHLENKKYGLPAIMGIIILSDPGNGFPLCVMDGTYPTSLRTGAAGAIAAKYLARKDSSIVALVGCGVQAKMQLISLQDIFRIKEVRVWGHERPYIDRFIKDMKKSNLKLAGSKNIEDCVKGSDIVVTTTPSRKPLVKIEWLKKGAHINAIGADAEGKQELAPCILKKAKVVVDSWEQASHSGEINVALSKRLINKSDIYADIGEIVTGKKKGRINNSELTVFDSTGLAVQDTAIADLIYRKAIRKKAGRWTEFV